MASKEKLKTFTRILLDKTTVSALTQIKMAKSRMVKAIWMMLFFVGIGFAIFQSSVLIMAYLKFSVHEKREVALTVPIPIPALTVCSNSILNWPSPEVDKIFNITGRLRAAGVHDPSQLDFHTSFTYFSEILTMLTKFSEQERIALGIDTSQFMLGCSFCSDYGECKNVKNITTNNHYYGNCITLEANHSICEDPTNMNENGYYRVTAYVHDSPFATFHEDVAIVIAVHAKGTAPILKMENVIKIYPGEYLEINVAQKEFTKLPWPYTSECVQNDDKNMQWKNLAHNEEHPYLYTMEACQQSCLQNLSLVYCKCINPTRAIRGPLSEGIQLCFGGCNKIPKEEVAYMCGCKQSCNHVEFDVTVHRNPSKFKTGLVKTQLEKSFLCYWKITNALKNNISNMVAFSVTTSTHFTDRYIEEATFTSADLIGSIGGLFGIWVGMSVMSLMEVIGAIGYSIFTKLKHKCQNVKNNNEELETNVQLRTNDIQQNVNE